ncbi:hypothetical protein KEJ43_06050, partial [Candidatus Bathyarchaeota archaeon]|nr:hypothetical protein [Candidatus Bathyarchaeota archaeon]
EIIREIGAASIPTIVALNKIDLVSPEGLKERIDHLSRLYRLKFIPISALRGINLEALKEEIAGILRRYTESTFTMPISRESLSLLSWIFENTNVQKVAYTDDSISVSLSMPPHMIGKIKDRVEKIGGKFG